MSDYVSRPIKYKNIRVGWYLNYEYHRDGFNLNDVNYIYTTHSYKRDLRGKTQSAAIMVAWCNRDSRGPNSSPYAFIGFENDVHHAILTIDQLDRHIDACNRLKQWMIQERIGNEQRVEMLNEENKKWFENLTEEEKDAILAKLEKQHVEANQGDLSHDPVSREA